MHEKDRAAETERLRRRSGMGPFGTICCVFVAMQILVMMFVPFHLRAIVAGLLTVATFMVVIVVALEASFKRAEARAAQATARVPDLPRRRPRERVSPHVQRAYRLARNDASAALIAGCCDIPHAFAVLIIDDVRRNASSKGRAERRPASGRSRGDRRGPKNRPTN